MSKRNRSAAQIAAILAIALAAFWAGIRQTPAQQESTVTTDLFPPHPIYGEFVNQFMLSASCVVTDGIQMDCWGHDDEIIDWEQEGLVTVVSTSTQDSASGTGASSVLLLGIRPDGAFQVESVALNGTTPVVSILQFKSPISAMNISGVGSGGSLFNFPAAVGNISATIGGANAGIIRADRTENMTMTGGVRAANGFTSVVLRLTLMARQVAGGGTGNADVFVMTKKPGESWLEALPAIPLATGGEAAIQIDGVVAATPGSLFRISVISDTDVIIRVAFLANVYRR